MTRSHFATIHLALLTAAALVVCCDIQAQDSAETKAVNLAVVATPTTSFVSGHETLGAMNDGSEPRNSNDRRHGQYGNWPSRGTQWVQYNWDQKICTDKIDVYWWNDQQGVRTPTACRLLYWDGQAFQPVKNASGLERNLHQYNTTTFGEVTTSKLRLEIDGDGTFSTGILEWKVYDSGNSPAFPPRVDAGVDRVVIESGKTYLRGSIQTLSAGQTTEEVRWTKKSGPGRVTFADASAAATTATFSQPGSYALTLTAISGKLSSDATLHVKVLASPPAKQLELIDTGSYTINSPLWNDRAKALIVNWVPHCITKINDPNLKEGGINNFIDAANKLAGKPHGSHRGYVFSNAWVYNTIESICIALMVNSRGDQEILAAQKKMRATLDDWIPKVLAAQESDGYLQTLYTLSDRERWSPRHRGDHEGYVAGYFLEAAVSHYMLTAGQDTRLYDAAKKLADCWNDNIGPSPKKAWYDGHQAMEIALVRFGRFVNKIDGAGEGDKYIALGKFLLDCREGGSQYDQSHVPVIEQYEAVGHAVRASYSYAAMADVAMETHDIDYQSATMSLWDNIVNRKYYLTGGIGSGETSEGFGEDYSLRHNAYCESCSSCGEIFFQHKLCLMHHDAQYADLYEETLYNALLGSIDLAGENFYYQNPLEERRTRYDWHGCPCCVGNIPRTLLMLPTWMYAKDNDSLYVNLFVGSRVNVGDVAGTEVEVIQETDYPWAGNVAILVNPKEPCEFAVKIRSPNHSVSELYSYSPESNGFSSVSVNGQVMAPAIKQGYAVIQRTWKAGDRIELVLPMTLQRVKGVEAIEATRGQVALRRGPLIFAFEEKDQDLNQEKVLPPKGELQAKWEADLLNGTVVVKGTWADQTPLTAIPYFLRNNRVDPSASDGQPRASGRRRGSLSRVWVRDQ